MTQCKMCPQVPERSFQISFLKNLRRLWFKQNNDDLQHSGLVKGKMNITIRNEGVERLTLRHCICHKNCRILPRHGNQAVPAILLSFQPGDTLEMDSLARAGKGGNSFEKHFN